MLLSSPWKIKTGSHNNTVALENSTNPNLKGLAYGIGCYVLWGLLPVFWKFLSEASSLEIFAYRMLWSFIFAFIFAMITRRSSTFALMRNKRALLILGCASLLIACNWFVYIAAVNSGHIVETALWYYINPLFVIILGVFVSKEKLTLCQKIATVLAAIGVLYFAFSYGSFPFIAIILGVTFAVYGALKKKGAYPAVEALTVESLFFVPIALVLIVITFFLPDRVFFADIASPDNLLLSFGLISAGLVTVVPLLLFALGANTVPLSWMGFLQYIAPTLALLLGVFVFGEEFTTAHAVCFACIWAGLALISGEMFVRWLRS